MPLIKPPLANLMSCYPRATCYIAQCCHLANSITCHARATGHMTGCCRLANSMSCHPKASKAKQRCVGLMGVGMCLYAHLNLQTKHKQSHVSYCRLQKFHLPFENRSSLNIDVSLKCGPGFVQNIENMLPLDRWHTSSYSSSIVSMVFFCFILLLHVTFPVHCATY